MRGGAERRPGHEESRDRRARSRRGPPARGDRFFEDSHERCAHTIFHYVLLLVRGTVEAPGPRRTVAGEMAWDLDEDGVPPEPPTGRKPSSPSWARPPAPTPTHAGPSQTIPVGTAGALMHPGVIEQVR
ncbi:hypothetical protein [Streptomyces sp. NPDC003730]